MMQEHGNEGSQESLIEGALVKDKFGNTLNLINTSDSALHRHISDSDIRWALSVLIVRLTALVRFPGSSEQSNPTSIALDTVFSELSVHFLWAHNSLPQSNRSRTYYVLDPIISHKLLYALNLKDCNTMLFWSLFRAKKTRIYMATRYVPIIRLLIFFCSESYPTKYQWDLKMPFLYWASFLYYITTVKLQISSKNVVLTFAILPTHR